MQRNIIAPTTSAKSFTWNKTDRTGVTFASDLGFRAGQTPGHRIYDDACDFGFLLENPSKGTKELFVLKDWNPQIVNGEHTGEGHWEYVSTTPGVNARLVIFND